MTPTITAPTVTGKKNNQIKVALKVKDFNAIQAMSLRLEFLKSVLTFKKAVFADKLTEASTPQFAATPIDDETMKFKISWSSLKPVTLKKNQVLAYLYFKCAKQAGETVLHWNNEVSKGNECVFAIVDKIPTALPDGPGNFVDGKVTVK